MLLMWQRQFHHLSALQSLLNAPKDRRAAADRAAPFAHKTLTRDQKSITSCNGL